MTSGSVTSYDFLYGPSKTSLTNTLSTLATAASVSAITPTSLGLGNVANTSPSGLPISTATQAALSTLTTSATNAGTTATTALNATNSVLNNINTSNTYFPGFPADQIAWTIVGGASSTNSLSGDGGRYQLLNFPSTGASLTLTSSNNCPSQPCTFTVSVMLGNAASFTLSITYGGITYGSVAYTQNLSTTQYTNISLSFNAPGVSVSALNFNITNATGTLYTRGWAAFAGSSVKTLLRGNLNVPYGSVSSSDFIYGGSGTSLAATIPTLATAASVSAITPTYLGLGNVANTSPSGLPISTLTQNALNAKVNWLNPNYSGNFNNSDSSFIIGTAGNVNCGFFVCR